MRAIVFVALSILVSGSLRAEFANDLTDATKPLSEGVPEVAVVRLRGLLAKNVADGEWCAIAEKLAEALIMAHQPSEALSLLDDARARDMTWAKFWRAQALADLQRPVEALPLYKEVAADEKTEFRTNAIFGAGEMLRSLKRSDEALRQFAQLLRDPQFGVQSRLRSAELFLDKGDIANARRILEGTQPKTGATNKNNSFCAAVFPSCNIRKERSTAFNQFCKNLREQVTLFCWRLFLDWQMRICSKKHRRRVTMCWKILSSITPKMSIFP